jgi:hypothetical protein
MYTVAPSRCPQRPETRQQFAGEDHGLLRPLVRRHPRAGMVRGELQERGASASRSRQYASCRSSTSPSTCRAATPRSRRTAPPAPAAATSAPRGTPRTAPTAR